MPFIRVNIDLAFPMDEQGKMDPETQEAHDLLLSFVAKAKKAARDVSANEGTTLATRHVCRHDVGLPCVEEETLSDLSAEVTKAKNTKVVKDAEAGIAAGKVK